jgi:hypothetical protein
MDTPANRKAAKKRRLREKRAAAHKPTAADDAATSSLSNSPAIDLSTTTSTDTDNSISAATLSASEDVTPAPLQPPEPLWDSLSDTHREAENYYCKQLLRTAPIATYLIVEPPEYTETVTPPAQSARDNGDTVEQVDAKLLRMEQHWAESRSSPFPESIRSAIADLRLAVERKETEAAWDAAVQVCAVHAAELEEQSEEGLEEEESERRLEEENERRINEEEQTEFAKEVRTEMTGDDAPRQQPAWFDWATNNDESIGPVPSASEFRPTTPPQPVRPSLTPTVIPPDDNVVPHACTIATSTPTAPCAPVNPSPNTPVRLPDPIAAAFAKPDPIAPTASTPSIVHGPRDFSALRSDTRNPWGSIHHRRYRSCPVRRDSGTDTHRYLHRDPLHSRHLISPPPLPFNSSYFRAKPPVQNLQIIQHPRGISPTKPKITKTIPTNLASPVESQEQFRVVHCPCGNIIPSHRQHQDSWKSTDTRRRTFKRGFERGFERRSRGRLRRRFWDWERGRSHLGGGEWSRGSAPPSGARGPVGSCGVPS